MLISAGFFAVCLIVIDIELFWPPNISNFNPVRTLQAIYQIKPKILNFLMITVQINIYMNLLMEYSPVSHLLASYLSW